MIPLAPVIKAFVIVLRLTVFMESLVIGVSILGNSQHITIQDSLVFKIVVLYITGRGAVMRNHVCYNSCLPSDET